MHKCIIADTQLMAISEICVRQCLKNPNSQAILEDNLIDSSFLGLAIGDTVDCKLIELLPVIKLLFEKGYVSLMVNGNYEDVEMDD